MGLCSWRLGGSIPGLVCGGSCVLRIEGGSVGSGELDRGSGRRRA